MSKITVGDGLSETVRLLTNLSNKRVDEQIVESINFCRMHIAQMQIFKLNATGVTCTEVARRLRVTEKTARMWRKAKHCPNLKHANALNELYQDEVENVKSAR